MDINFLTSNPAIDEYNHANKIAGDETTQKLKNQKEVADTAKSTAETALSQNALQENQTTAPTRLRMMNAQADTATANATTAGVNAQFAPQQAQAQLQQTRAQIGEMSARTAALHMDAFGKEMALLDSGDVEGAKRLAASVGDTIPDAVINSGTARAAIKNVTATAQQLYPGRPKDQMTYITAHIAELGNQQQQGQPINPQTAPYTQPPGVPTPQQQGGTQEGETERIAANIRDEAQKAGKPITYEDSIVRAHANQEKYSIQQQRLATEQATKDPNFYSDPEGTYKKYGVTPQGVAPAAAPAQIPQRPPAVPQGSAFSPSRNMWKAQDGTLYGADGQVIQAAAPQAPPAPQVPISQ